MPIQFPCKSCGQTLSVAEEHSGKQARCPSCQTVQAVPLQPMSGEPYNPSPTTLSFGGSVFDSPNANNPPFSPLSSSRPSSPGTNSPAAPDSGGGLFDGLTPNAPINPSNAQNQDVYYLEAPGGSVYGPVDWRTLIAWKNQGRIGPGYRIRKGENGPWQVASSTELFTSSANPFADTIPAASSYATPQYQAAYSSKDRSGLILALGIISWVLMLACGPLGTIAGIMAWIMGGQDLRAVREGRLNPQTISNIQVGYYLGMVQVILSVLCIGGYVIFFMLAIALENM
jgi:hypothetical protein